MKKIFRTVLLLLIISVVPIDSSMAANFKGSEIEGFLMEIEDSRVIVEEYGGMVHAIPFSADNIKYAVDDRIVGKEELKSGMEVYGQIRNGKMVSLEGYSVANPGYIQPGEKLRTGIVHFIDRDQIKIRRSNGEVETYFISPGTVVIKEGQNVGPEVLYIGDNVKLHFDEADVSFPSRISVEGSTIKVKDLYRGKIAQVDRLEDVVVVSDVDAYSNGKWRKLGRDVRLPYNGELPIYIGGQKINKNNLKYYKGKTVYMAMKDNFSVDQIERMIVKSQYETNFSEKIQDINWFSSQMKLSNMKNIKFHDGTMVIKSGRLVDVTSLTPGTDGFIVADGRGNDLRAEVIYVHNEGVNNSNIGQDHIYAGRLGKLLENDLELRDFFLLENNRWISFPESKELFYDEDTFIFDVETKKIVEAKEFYTRGYSTNGKRISSSEEKSGHNRDWYSYVYTNGDRISGIFVSKSIDSLLNQRATTGSVIKGPEEIKHIGYRMTINNGANWSQVNSKWMPMNADVNINLDGAMIIKNGKLVKIEDIKIGDSIYSIRDSNEGKVVIIK